MLRCLRAKPVHTARCEQAAEGPNGKRALKLTRATPEELAALAERKRQARWGSEGESLLNDIA